jgi:isoleucyl-tRNA synthetase
MTRYRPVDSNERFPALEERMLAQWRELDVFHESLRRREGAPLWVFYEGPPTANGAPGAHHVLSRVFKDIFPRYKTMCGFMVPRKAGWDCHGLPVELEVERALGIGSKDEIERYGIAEFNQKCRESVFSYVEEWNRLTERIGFWIDLDDAYVTLANEYMESVWWSLREIWDQGLLYEGHKVVPYCPRCGTPLSSHEVALGYHDVVDPSIYVRFPVAQPAGPLVAGDVLLIWTTTPWTLVSNAAVAMDPELTYVRARANGGVYVLAEPRVGPVLGEGAEILDRFPGREIEGTAYEPPFDFIPAEAYGERAHMVLPADFVSAEDGTGLVHTAIAFGEDDFRLGEQHGLAVVNPVRPDGTFDERIGPFTGRFVKDADPDLIADLERRGLLFRAEEYEHSYPHCWRCDTPLLYYAKSSWYIRTTARRDELLRANEEVEWYPFHIKHGRFGKWLENNVDWSLSRERYWGTPLPVWRCAEDHDHCVGSIAELRELAIDSAGKSDPVPGDLHRPYIDDVKLRCPECGGEMSRVEEVIDAWYDSGSMPFAQFHYPFENASVFEQRFPADFICEALDQTRGWFYSLLAISTLLFGRASYRNVLCLGLILDPDGQKMSKSRGNVVAPWDVLDRHGADALRWYYFTSQQPWSGYRFSLETVGESVRKFLLTLWNTYSFYVLYANVDGFDHAAHDLPAAARSDLDRWALSRLQATIAAVREGLDGYDTTSAGRSIASFVDDLSNWFVRRSRRRFWRPAAAVASAGAARAAGKDEEDKISAYLTLHECLVTVAKLLAPFTPFVADEIYSNLAGEEISVHLCDFPEADPDLVDKDLDFDMAVARRTVELGRAARSQAGIKVRQPLREAVVVANERERAAIARLEALVLDELNVKELSYVSEADELGRYEVKPNYRQLGPRFGSRTGAVTEAIQSLDPAEVASALDRGEQVRVLVGDAEESLGAEELTLVMEPPEGYQLERQASYAVALKLDLDAELKREGFAREVVHAVQNARKEAGLQVEDRIELSLSGDAALVQAVRSHADYISGETLATTLELDGKSPGDAHTGTARIDGSEVAIALRRAG